MEEEQASLWEKWLDAEGSNAIPQSLATFVYCRPELLASASIGYSEIYRKEHTITNSSWAWILSMSFSDSTPLALWGYNGSIPPPETFGLGLALDENIQFDT